MKFINIDFKASKSDVLSMIMNNERVNCNVRFDSNKGKPLMKFKEKNGRIKITCEMIGGPSKDNGFIVGTYFTGKVTEKNGVTSIKGVITTAPIYHLIMLAFFTVFIVQCFRMKGFSVVPILLVIFSIFIFKDEYKKQGYIRRYLYRAARRISENKSSE